MLGGINGISQIKSGLIFLLLINLLQQFRDSSDKNRLNISLGEKIS